MTWFDFLKNKFLSLVIHFISLIIIIFVLSVFQIQIEILIIISFLIIISHLVSLYIEGKNEITFFAYFKQLLDSLDQKYLIGDLVEEPAFYEGEFLVDSLRKIGSSMIDQINFYKLSQKEYKEFIELWIHEVKTPLSACLLLAQKRDDKNMITELNQIQDFLEQALFYARSQYAGKDYIIRDVDLEKIVENVLIRYRQSFILKNIKAEIQLNHDIVKCDGKWLEFIIGQIIGNSLKYTKEHTGMIQVYSKKEENSLVLYIEDNGVGIPAQDLPRVFDKGFTGLSGRKDKHSTGIGLYLCKMLCDKLNLNIGITSDSTTIVAITFPLSKHTSVYEN